jgi:hypothetical protein
MKATNLTMIVDTEIFPAKETGPTTMTGTKVIVTDHTVVTEDITTDKDPIARI